MHQRVIRVSCFVASCVAAITVRAQSESDVWLQLLRVTGHARGVRAALVYQCREHLATAPRYMVPICSKLPRIPDRVLEVALVPYAKQHLSMSQARDAVATWSTPESQTLVQKVLDDVESGGRLPLSPEEIRALRVRSDTEFGKGLLDLGKDVEALRAVVKEMASYEP